MSYQVVFCFWLLTFEQQVAEQLNQYVHSSPPPPASLLSDAHHGCGNCRKYDVIPLLTDVAQNAVKEKVIRVVVATFRVRPIPPSYFSPLLSSSLCPHRRLTIAFQNMVAKAPAANLPAMLVARLLPFAKNLSTRKWTDEDIAEDVAYLRDELNANFQSLTCVLPLLSSFPLRLS
jgi:V-type H+-transporting ATPase subunit H